MERMTPTAIAKTWALIALGIGLDQWTKAWALSRLPGRPIVVIPGALDLAYAENRNAAFGLGSFLPDAMRPYVLLAVTLGLTAVLTWLMVKSPDLASRIGFASVISGALGNIIDRVRLGFVVDFVYWHGGFRWPNFNVADSLICAGAGVLLVFGSRRSPEDRKPATRE